LYILQCQRYCRFTIHIIASFYGRCVYLSIGQRICQDCYFYILSKI
jgi:hypothetical protein